MGFKSLEDKRKEAKERNDARNKRSIAEQMELIKTRPGKSEKESRRLHQQQNQKTDGNKKKGSRPTKAQSN